MMSALESHMTCIEPLKTYDINHIWIPYLVIKDDEHYYFSDLKYHETTYRVYDSQEPTVEFDFEFSYAGSVIEEHHVDYMEVAYNKWLQVYKNAVFEKDDLKDMYLVFYKNKRHNGDQIYDVSVYYNMKKVLELEDFKMFCDENSNMDFCNFSYIKIPEPGYEETWRVTDFLNEELENRYDPWEDAKQKRAEEEAVVESVFSMDYEELKKDAFQYVKEIRNKMYALIGEAYEHKGPEELIDDEEIKKAFQIYISRNTARIAPPDSAGKGIYELTKIEKENDKCLVFENEVITDYIHLSSNAEAEWDRDDYHKGRHYAEDCRYIRLDGTTYDLLNPKDIMSIPIGKSKIDSTEYDSFLDLIGYNKYDLKLQRIRETETDRFNAHFWNNEQIGKLVNLIDEQGEAAIEIFIGLTHDYCKSNEILLTKSDLEQIIVSHAYTLKQYLIDGHEVDCLTPAWCIDYLRTINPGLEVKQVEQEDDEYDSIMDFWDYNRSLDFVKTMEHDGLEEAIDCFSEQAVNYCDEHDLDINADKFIDYILDSLGVSDSCEEDFEDDYEDDDYDDNESNFDLYELLESRTTGCFEPTLLVPLAHITVNMAIRGGGVAHGCERIVAQLVANGEVEYGKFLDAELSKRSRYWDKSQSVPYGESLVNWAKNAREYHWLSGNYPELAPKSKAAYSTAKKKRSKRYLELKQLAESNGYLLDDYTCDYSCW